MLKRIDVGQHLDPLVELSKLLLTRHADELPNLGQTIVILPDLVHSKALRKALLENTELKALIPPRMLTLRQWACEQFDNPLPLINNHGRELMMVEVLREHPTVFGKNSQSWSLADELLVLFDELNLSTFDADNFLERFQKENDFLSNFSEDAQKIQILWQARDQNLQQEGVTDRNTLYRNAMHKILERKQDQCDLYLVGMDSLSTLELKMLRECSWLNATEVASSNLDINDSGFPALSQFFDAAFEHQDTSLLDRATEFKSTHQNSPCDGVKLVASGNREEEAAVIDLQIRHWLIEDKQRIAVVTEDRLLARRVSALLGRADLEIFDSAGWPLSTTRAAGTVEHWLLSIENDFHSLHLLDLLKSGFLQLSDDELKSLHFFEKAIVAKSKIYFSIPDYLACIEQYEQSNSGQERLNLISKVLERLGEAAKPLSALCDGKQHQAKKYIQATLSSFAGLGLDKVLEDDPAGRRILQELEDMRQGLAQRNLSISWTDFRAWFGRAMETHNFRPDMKPGGVTISNYQQSILGNFDAVILAGCDQKALPKKPARQGVFNNDVRYELGLRNWSKNRDIIQNRFRRLLQAAPEVLLSYTSETARGPQLPSPWITIIESFHKATWGEQSLRQYWQLQTVREKTAEPAIIDDAPIPEKKPRARAKLNIASLPKKISASKHQSLIDCPYKFFSSSILNIHAWDDIDTEFRKKDFGELVHRCLQEFHSKVKIIDDRDAAVETLLKISGEKFKPIVDQQIVNHGWWHTWKTIAPKYIDWQSSWQDSWSISKLEKKHKKNVAQETKVMGVLDRVDRKNEHTAILDYKTGGAVSIKKITAGEDVQLLTYGMLVDGITDLLYLYVGDKKGVSKKQIGAKEFPEELIESAKARLNHILELMKKGTELPAWGHEDVCKYCDFIGLCRKGSWDEASSNPAQQ